MPRGGKRQGVKGRRYDNRVDLQLGQRKELPVTAAANQTYGERGAQEQAQRAIPMARPGIAAPPLDAPTQRPHEPVTAGAPVGPGPGPEVLGTPVGREAAIDRLRRAYLDAVALGEDSEGLRAIIEMNE